MFAHNMFYMILVSFIISLLQFIFAKVLIFAYIENIMRLNIINLNKLFLIFVYYSCSEKIFIGY
ncbi:MAG TPA: hypothetical protein DCS83_08295 [Prevotella sp.]|nr:hypothetical protein [Prevotella sp.]